MLFGSNFTVEFIQTRGQDSQVVSVQKARRVADCKNARRQACYSEIIERKQVKRSPSGKNERNSGDPANFSSQQSSEMQIGGHALGPARASLWLSIVSSLVGGGWKVRDIGDGSLIHPDLFVLTLIQWTLASRFPFTAKRTPNTQSCHELTRARAGSPRLLSFASNALSGGPLRTRLRHDARRRTRLIL